MTKSQIIQALTADGDLNKKQAQKVLDTLASLAAMTLKSDGKFTVPGLVRLTLKDKPATPERQGINPFTKAKVTIPAKPASKKVRALPVSSLKDAVV
jgi:nucleoid DNA-binding protein